ncbi:J domain-containing protein [Haloarchaeobius salinus]|uniref:J domain-containing protein n=1 Tax=Haloarchaeobius salinus TaxID=1198298 RepID=UPI00210D29FE|nr:J domain-containing protein [Haloarchaeobius salinus]
MAVVERHACEGCDREFSLDNLHAVTMPGGSRAVCCPECREYAETVGDNGSDIDQRRRECDGCTEEHLVSELEEVILSDGTSVLCCASCAEHAPSSGDGSDARRQEENEAETAAELESKEPSKASRQRNLCQQCNDWYSIELYRVVTVDDRTEKFCPDCMEQARDDGIVKDVRMRRAEAYEVLGASGFEDADDLRDAYISRVKQAHPDRADGSRAEFKRVQAAYDRLQDEF